MPGGRWGGSASGSDDVSLGAGVFVPSGVPNNAVGVATRRLDSRGNPFVPGEEVILFTFGKGKQSPVHLVLETPGDPSKTLSGEEPPVLVEVVIGIVEAVLAGGGGGQPSSGVGGQTVINLRLVA